LDTAWEWWDRNMTGVCSKRKAVGECFSSGHLAAFCRLPTPQLSASLSKATPMHLKHHMHSPMVREEFCRVSKKTTLMSGRQSSLGEW